MSDNVPGITDPIAITYCTRCDIEIEEPNKLCRPCVDRNISEQRARINAQQREAARREREAARG